MNAYHHLQRSDTDCIACSTRLCASPPAAHALRPSRTVLLRRGERLAVEDDSCRRVWTVVSGTAAVCTNLLDGRRQILGLEMPGDMICGSLTAPGTESWLEALNACTVCEIDLENAADNPLLSGRMMRYLQGRVEHFALHIVTLGRLDGMERVCLFLAEMARRIGVGDERTRRVSLAMSREDIADYLGLNAETVSRLFSKLKKSGLVTFLSPTEFLVNDMAALEGRAPLPTVEKRHRAAPPPAEAVLAAQGGRI